MNPELVAHMTGTSVTISRPGDLLTWMIFKITGERTCGPCDKRRKQMNKWGWWKCWRERKTILDWLFDEAHKRGIAVDDATAFSLFKTALKEATSKKKGVK